MSSLSEDRQGASVFFSLAKKKSKVARRKTAINRQQHKVVNRVGLFGLVRALL